METKEILKKVDDREFIDKIYQFAYRRCNTSHEAEDLCSDIIIAIIAAIHKRDEVENFYAFVWTIARRVYADFCEMRSKTSVNISIENAELKLPSKENEIENFVEETVEAEQIKKIFEEISYLSKAYRDVMVMYYIDEYKVKDIAIRLGISETTVKQRLFYARNSVRKEVENMNDRNLSLKPVKLDFIGTGNPCGNDPRIKAERLLSQNLIYLCKDKPRSAKELSEELCIPMPYVEEELEIQCKGENGKYGTLRRLENGKYITNILLVDYSEYEEVNKIFKRYLPEFCENLKTTLKKNEENIVSFPYLSEQKDSKFILWTLISRTFWDFQNRVNNIIKDTYFSDVIPAEREFSCVAIASDSDEQSNYGFYGGDGISANSVGGYSSVSVFNIYGKRIEKHFACGHNMSQDEKLLMLIRAIGGISVKDLSENEKEVAAKAIECGYLRKNGDILEPKIIVVDRKESDGFFRLSFDLNADMQEIIEKIAEELAGFMKAHIPNHLMDEYQLYTSLIAGQGIISDIIEACIKEGLLNEPEQRIGAEGVLMIVEK